MSATRPEDIPGLIAESFNTSNPQLMLDLFEPTGVLVTPPSGDQEVGLDAISVALDAMFEVIKRSEIKLTSVMRTGELAMTHADWRLQGVGTDGAPVDLKGRGTVVSRQQPDSTWKIIFDDPVGV